MTSLFRSVFLPYEFDEFDVWSPHYTKDKKLLERVHCATQIYPDDKGG